MHRLRRLSVWLVLGLLAVLAAAWGLGTVSLPRTTGTVQVDNGLDRPATLLRDGRGVPTVTAGSLADAVFALGFAHAQDRLFQLDLHRRIAGGRLSEIMGRRTVGLDRHMRTLGLEAAARSSLAVLEPETLAVLEAYAAGINAGRRSLSILPPEYLLLGADFAPWTPLDTLTFSRLMAFRLSGNWREEAVNAALLDHLGADRYAAFKALSSDTAGASPPPLGAVGVGRLLHRLAEDWPAEAEPLVASNWWMVDAAHAAGGGALLANDPHLELQAPIQWYLAVLRLPGRTLAGATLPGLPYPLIGHNGHLAWGLTTTHSDTADLVIEDDGPGSVVTLRRETIRIKNAAPVTLEVRETAHGPVVSDLVDLPLPAGRVVALESAALAPGDTSADALRRVVLAPDRATAMDALRRYHAPQQNIALVTTDGSIGFVSPGCLPLRGLGDGTLPRSAAAEEDWRGWVTFGNLPQAAGSDTGILVNANNRPVAEDWPAFLGADFPPPYRATRITEALAALRRPDATAMAVLQTDTLSLPLRALAGHLAEVPPAPGRDLLLAWDGRMDADRPEPLLAQALLMTAEAEIFADDLGETFDLLGGHRPREVLAAVADPSGRWCGAPGCRAELGSALARTMDSLGAEFGPDPATWRWGDAHRAQLTHPLFRHLPVLGPLTSLAVPASGGPQTVNRADVPGGSPDMPWRQRLADVHGPGLRFVVDMAAPGAARAVIATGQSGHPLSPHYGDQVEAWRTGRLFPLEADGDGDGLRLMPLKNTR
jgi:penicillin amidase